ncbi:MAG: molybdopterin cofactor-binding domain-containing protein [Thermaurantiacus sp.]
MLQKTPTDAPAANERRRFLPSRRAFLVGAAATVGVVVGFAVWPRSYPPAWTAGEGETLFNAWLRVGADGRVTVAVPQAEMGQGSWSGLAQILADELGADWRMVGVEPAAFHPDYAHVGMVRLGTASLPPMLRDVAAFAGETAIRRLNLQMTGGSTSIKGYHDILREAGATARALIVDAAGRAWGVDPALLDTRNGFVVYQAQRMPIGEAAVRVDAARWMGAVSLRPESARPLAGRPVTRLDIPPKVDGTARFAGDVRLPGMVFASIRHGPIGGRLVAVQAPEGVQTVNGPNWVAAVGPTSWEARRALSRVTPRFEIEGRPAGDWIVAGVQASLDAEGGVIRSEGDVAAALGGDALTADYSVPFLAHVCMEPMVAAARVVDGRVEVWAPTQSVTLATWAAARALGIDQSAVLIHPTLVGGGFGRKAETDHVEQAALIARAIGRPVLLQWSREEDSHADMFRPPAAARMRGKVAADGRLAALDLTIAAPVVGNSFARRNMPRLAPGTDRASGSAIEGASHVPYRADAFRATHVAVSQPVPLGYWRSVGHSYTAFFVESFIDELAAASGRDPLAFRLALLDPQGPHARVLRAVAEAGRWGAPVAEGFGRGVALHESFGAIVAQVVEAGVRDGQIRIARLVTAIDCGRAINPDSVTAQMEGGAIYGLTAALWGETSFAQGYARERNFNGLRMLALGEAPEFQTVILSSSRPLGGAGEPATPPAAPALANALFAATGIRARHLPLAPQFD